MRQVNRVGSITDEAENFKLRSPEPAFLVGHCTQNKQTEAESINDLEILIADTAAFQNIDENKQGKTGQKSRFQIDIRETMKGIKSCHADQEIKV